MTARMTADELRGLGYDPETGRRMNAAPAAAEPSAVERQNATGSDRRAAVALREPGATGEPGLQRPTNKYRNRRTHGPGPLGGDRLYAPANGWRLPFIVQADRSGHSVLLERPE